MTDFNHMPGHLIRRAHQRSVAAFAEATKNCDVTPIQFALLSAIAASTVDLDQVSLAQQVALDTSTAASALDRMQAKGWIERRLDAQDKRRRVLHLTRKGRQRLSTLRARVAAAQSAMMSPLTVREQETLIGLLTKLAAQSEPAAA